MNYPLYNNTLNPKVWNKRGSEWVLKPEVRLALLTLASDFMAKQKSENKLNLLKTDVLLIGSMTNFNWTPFSDFDLHVVVDFKSLEMSENDAQVLLDGQKSIWNTKHNVKIKGHDVELYVQSVTAEPVSMSSYSVQHGKWIKLPKMEKPTFDKGNIRQKHKQFLEKIQAVLRNPTEPSLESILNKLYGMRQAGLDKKGEFSEENIVFKILRAQGVIEKLKDAETLVYDAEQSLKERETG